jgi:hypothetical protein
MPSTLSAASSTESSPPAGAIPGMPPANQAPQLCSLVRQPPSGSSWLTEVTFDGYRFLAGKTPAGVRLVTPCRVTFSVHHFVLVHRFPHPVARRQRTLGIVLHDLADPLADDRALFGRLNGHRVYSIIFWDGTGLRLRALSKPQPVKGHCLRLPARPGSTS